MLLEHNIASRELLLDSIGKMKHEDFIRNMNVGRESIQGILVHLMITETYWISVVTDSEMKPIDKNGFPDVESIRRKWQEIGNNTQRFVDYQNESSLQHVKSVVWGERTVSFTVARALIHMATHETHHRGLIVGLMRQLNYEPPSVNMM